jgi:hypothetical protein
LSLNAPRNWVTKSGPKRRELSSEPSEDGMMRVSVRKASAYTVATTFQAAATSRSAIGPSVVGSRP